MKDKDLWKFIAEALDTDRPIILLSVIDHKGSSPGKQGFKMAVDHQGDMAGSIGGGNVEYQLVEQAKQMLADQITVPRHAKQIHRENADTANKSGMICSGEQTVTLHPLQPKQDKAAIQRLLGGFSGILELSPQGINLLDPEPIHTDTPYHYTHADDNTWHYHENLAQYKTLYIFGGGHVSLALSEVISVLNFHIVVFDDRPNIHTLERNPFAHEKHIIDYTQIPTDIKTGANSYVAIMTASHSADDIVLEQLVNKSFKYLGMMASRAKKQLIFTDLINRGISPEQLHQVHAPIGLDISSKTPAEIAISIAAEIIAVSA